jgi:uncharacterized protein YjbI with pentapeptide repeats
MERNGKIIEGDKKASACFAFATKKADGTWQNAEQIAENFHEVPCSMTQNPNCAADPDTGMSPCDKLGISWIEGLSPKYRTLREYAGPNRYKAFYGLVYEDNYKEFSSSVWKNGKRCTAQGLCEVGPDYSRTRNKYADSWWRNMLLNGANFSKNDMPSSQFVGSKLQGAIFDNSTLWKADFGSANLSNASFNNAYMPWANFTNANLSGADLTQVNFFEGDQLEHGGADADLSNARWIDGETCDKGSKGQCLRAGKPVPILPIPNKKPMREYYLGQNLDNLQLTNRYLAGFNFSNTRGKNVSFEGSNLQNANFQNSRLYLPNFKNADLRKANFKGATFYDPSQNIPNDEIVRFKGYAQQEFERSGSFDEAMWRASGYGERITLANTDKTIIGMCHYILENNRPHTMVSPGIWLGEYNKVCNGNPSNNTTLGFDAYFGGANFEGAIWFDGRVCGPGSIGVCK